jgi:proteasome lid subunit RPN8/RPN11
MVNDNDPPDIKELKSKLKKEIRKQLKHEIKKEVLLEIYQELKDEETKEEEILEKKISDNKSLSIEYQKLVRKNKSQALKEEKIGKKISSIKEEEKTKISAKAILKIATHAKKYANKNINRTKWVEVIGLLAGKLQNNGETLLIEDAYPMGHGNAIHAEIKDYNNYIRAYTDLQKKGFFICGWYHSHPSYGLFLSSEDMGTQARYQKLWKKSVALVIDPYQIDGHVYGFNIFRANLKTAKWYEVPFSIKGNITPNVLPELLDFTNPIVEGKDLFLEYDE